MAASGAKMADFPVFLSLILTSRNQAGYLTAVLTEATQILGNLVSDYEIIVIDNASDDDSVSTLKQLTGAGGLPNLQIFALTREVDADTAAWVGLENALGDFIAIIDPMTDDIGFLPNMLEHVVRGSDVVFASNILKPRRSLAYKICFAGFNALYKWFNGIHLAKEAPQYRVLSKRVVNYILRHPLPAITYRHLPATGGFARTNLIYSSPPKGTHSKRLVESIDHGMRLLVSTTRGPMRVVTMLSLFGATSNLIYSIYVIAVALFKTDVEPGWVTLSLQQSGMFFLISLVLLVLGEYILNMVSLSNEGPPYHIAQEFTSAVMTRQEKLNIEETRALELFPEANLGKPGRLV
jgi:glycosyltransferase involved in cell wall biosynthesis